MPITKKKDGFYWGSRGPFKTRKKAVQVAQAAYASGYVKKSWRQILKKDMSYCVCSGPNKTKGFTCKAHCRSKELKKAPRIPRKKGQPAKSKKHSDLYTDENPKGTIHGLGFKDVKTAKASVSKIKRSGRSHAHKTQAAIAMEQRAREMGKTSEAAVYRKFIEQQKKKTQERKK